MTVLNLIQQTLQLLNINAVGDPTSNDEAHSIMQVLNVLLDQWNTQQFALYCVPQCYFRIYPGKGSYTIGPGVGADFPIAAGRPVKIERAFVRDSTQPSNPVDYQIEQIPNNVYQELVLKYTQSSYPTHMFYLTSIPNGTIYLYPVPSKSTVIYLNVWMLMPQYTTLTEEIELPPGYNMALQYALAVEIAPRYGKTCAKGSYIYDRAADLLRDIKTANHDMRTMTIDNMILGKYRGFNIYRGF